METLEKTILEVAKKAIYDAIKNELIGYNKPLSVVVNDVLASHSSEFRELIDCEVAGLLNSADFRTALKDALHEKLAKILIAQSGGELEKMVNAMKQNATTRAKITLAIDRLIAELF